MDSKPGKTHKSMIIALAQINTTQGDVPNNFAAIRQETEKAHSLGVRLLVFPELSLCGYCPKDVLFLASFIKRTEEAVLRLSQVIPQGIAILVGTARYSSAMESGKRVLNSACLIERGQFTYVADKMLLPNYDVFDEARYFIPGADVSTFDLDGKRFGATICEDIWGEVGGDPGMPKYGQDPAKQLVEQGASYLLNLSASPFALGKIDLRRQLLQAQAKRLSVPFALCNLVGGNDEIVFDGSSLFATSDGVVIAQGKSFETDLLICDTEQMPEDVGSQTQPLCEHEQLRRALVLGVRDYAHKSGFSRAILGLSGGIDSALTAAIAVEALGSENVHGVSMPSQYSAEMSFDDAKEIADNLEMSFSTIPIEAVFDATLETLSPHFESTESDVTEENLQPRIRGMYLMALSNKHHALLLSTGNKSELSVGYCTLYGDMCGGLAVLSDLPKGRVYSLSRYLNQQGREIIPQRTIDRAPSAELRPDQKDSDSLPDYDTLDEILRLAIEEHADIDEIVSRGYDRLTAKDVLKKLWRNEFKRKQMPPGLKVTSKAFGMGRRMPLTGGAQWCNDEDSFLD